jgi:hypothetical protein
MNILFYISKNLTIKNLIVKNLLRYLFSLQNILFQNK